MIFRSDVFLLLERGDPKPYSILSVIDNKWAHFGIERKTQGACVGRKRNSLPLPAPPLPSPRSLARATACQALARHSPRGSQTHFPRKWSKRVGE